MTNDMMKKVAANVGVSEDALKARADAVLAEQGAAWRNAGKNDNECEVFALRVAARQMASEAARLKRSGAETVEGMFISVPRYKDWGQLLYRKMENTLKAADDDARQALVTQGRVVLLTDNYDGTYTRAINPSLRNKQPFEADYEEDEVRELPKNCKQLDDSTHFYVVWDSKSPTFPSGDSNFKYGAARPTKELERTMQFLTSDGAITIKASGPVAEDAPPTFVPGTYAVRMGRNGVGYAKQGVSVFTADDAIAGNFSAPPFDVETGGLMGQMLGDDMLPNLDALGPFYDANNGTDGWYDRLIGVLTEVISIEPRNNGGYNLVVADLDITSMAPVVDTFVPASQEAMIDFAVGTKVLVIGQPWKTREDEYRLSINGWWAFDAIPPMADLPTDAQDDGWDA